MSKATIARAIRQRDHLLAILKRLDNRTIEDLERRGRFTVIPDGYRPTPANGTPSGDIARPTEGAVIARANEPPADPLAKTILHVFAALGQADSALAGVEHSLEVIRGYGTPAGRISSLAGDCRACERPVAGTPNDPLRKGYCNACRMAYHRWTDTHPVGDDPARHRIDFETWRRQTQVDTRPANCTHRCCTRKEPHDHWRTPTECPDCSISA